MSEVEENLGFLGELQTLETQNIVNINHNENYLSENNEVFNNISPLVTASSSENVGSGYPMESTSNFVDERGGLSRRIAARRDATCGFNAWDYNSPKINVARFRPVSPLSSPVARSPYITIPAGISPTELLDSPAMLHYSQAQPSPTTGTFQLSPLNPKSIALDSATPATDREIESDIGSSLRSQLLDNHVSSVESMGFELPVEIPRGSIENSVTELSADFEDSKIKTNHLASQPFLEGDQQGNSSASGIPKTEEDRYNWRKYGQKQVKGSEFPRSYYKCTHPNCLVKKIVERSHDGEVAEIIYRGAHNHLLPQPKSRSNIGVSFSDNGRVNKPGEDIEVGGIVWRNIQPKGDSKNVPSENLDTFAITQMKMYEVEGSHGPMGKHVCHDEDGTSLDGKTIEDDAYVDESESKRRKVELPFPETNVVSRGVREPRVVVQIESEVDILDDGYRWRKYGQKVVKGNPNPRSYYKCTRAGCPVRKHVERACDDYKFVITTYVGKHDHEVPVAKTAAVSVNGLSPATSSTHPTYTLPRINTNFPKAETQIQDLECHFEKIPDLGNEFMRSTLLGNFGNDMYPLNFPSLQNSMGYGYGGMPNFPMSLLYGVPRSLAMMPGGVDIYNMAAPVQSSVGGNIQ